MKWNALTDADEELPEHEVVFAVDEGPSGREHAVIADISTDEAWISAPTSDARTLSQWC